MATDTMFDHVLLEPEQKELLATLVQAARNVPRDQRQKFLVIQTLGENSVAHPGLPGGEAPAYVGDIEMLERRGLLNLTWNDRGDYLFDITPEGFAYYEYLKREAGEPVQRVTTEIRTYLDSDSFRQRHPRSLKKWVEAEEMLWRTDSQRQLTTSGHLCREAIQEFATELVEHCEPSGLDPDPQHVVARVRAVLEDRKHDLPSTVKPFLDALIAYWRALSDLIQRQEHGAHKEGESLVWEDARRLLFQTAAVMFEIDRTLASLS